MANTLYPLTSSQRMLHQALNEFGTAQVLTIGVCISIHAPVDFSLLKKCLIEEIDRLQCLRIQFTQPDREGEIRQYISAGCTPNISFENLKDKSTPEIKALMTHWSTLGFEDPDAPLFRFVMVSLPDGWNGVYLCIDHRIMDSCGLISMMKDTLGLYSHYLYKTPLPPMPASYEEALLADLKQEQNHERREKDRAFWLQQLACGEPIYTDITGLAKLEQSRIHHGHNNLRAADRIIRPMDGGMERFTLPKQDTAQLLSYCRRHSVSMTDILLMSMRTCLSHANGGEPDVSIRNYVSRRSSRQNRTCGGCRIHCYPCRTVITPDVSFLDGIRQIKTYQRGVYRHCDYDPAAVNQLFSDAFGMPPLTTYEGAALTCQPLPLSFATPFLKLVPLHVDWFSNKADIQKLYLTVMEAPGSVGLDFYFKYQTAELEPSDIATIFAKLSKILAFGTGNEDLTVGEIMERLPEL